MSAIKLTRIKSSPDAKINLPLCAGRTVISGFPRREESPYDVFNVGHSGTSISAASGFTEAGSLKGDSNKIIAVIGDGSMTTGMAFEGLNWTGDREKNMIIVLNDNEMSISPNVGALSSYLNRVMTGHTVTKLRADIKNLLKRYSRHRQVYGQIVSEDRRIIENIYCSRSAF